jgi:hypothetical protein
VVRISGQSIHSPIQTPSIATHTRDSILYVCSIRTLVKKEAENGEERKRDFCCRRQREGGVESMAEEQVKVRNHGRSG